MSVAEFPPRVVQPPAEIARPVDQDRPARFTFTLEHALYVGLFALALLTRLWGLGDRALHHDETLHAAYSWRLYTGQGFEHDPLLHGPFLYHIVALMYFLFGDNDFTARLSVALFSSALVLLPFLIRRELGRGAALLASAYLVLSPAFLYVGRFIRHDTYAVLFELLTVVSIVRYASTRQARWLFVGAAALGLMSATMETFYLFVAMYGALLALIFFWRIWRPGLIIAGALGLVVVALVFILPGKPQQNVMGSDAVTRASTTYVCPSAQNPYPPDNEILYTPGPLLGLPPLATADNDYALCVRNQYDDNFGIYFVKLGQFFGHPAILLALGLSTAGLAALYLLIWRRRDATGTTAWQRARASNDDIVRAFVSLGADWRVLIALAFFLTPYTLLFTAFFGHPTGIISGTTGSLLYWLAQHGVQRGGQPSYYYLIQLVIYEPLALLWGIVGLIMAGVLIGRRLRRPRSPASAIDWGFTMPLLLTWWALATLALYSWAGEKMPWLTIHVALPIVLLGAWALARALGWWAAGMVEPVIIEPPTEPAPDAAVTANGNGYASAISLSLRPKFWDGGLLIYLGIFTTIAALFFVLITIVAKPASGQQDAAPYIFPLALVLIGLLTVFAGLLRGPRWAIGALSLGVALILSLYGMRAAYQLSYRYGDDARELLIFVQTSPDVTHVVRALEQANTRRNGKMTLWYDNETIWSWYLRRFQNAAQQAPTLPAPGDDVMAVLLLQENIDSNPQNLQALQGFRIQRYPLRWWNPEYELYRLPQDWATAEPTENSALLMRLLRTPLDGRTAAQFWQYMIYRQLPAPLGSTDFVLAVRPELANEIGLGTGTEQK
ncbi:MAG TPA: flippase activity-associated protein Agl23 [Roseiflexaceae bacterium]|nr:flippase activity-associated protein Agl23 [Roseiflexaceae bacterium]